MMLERPIRPLPVVSIVPLIDVFLILLIFFMVTSTFLDLDMYPLSTQEQSGAVPQAKPDSRTVLMRVLPNGDLVVAGRQISADGIPEFFAAQSDQRPDARLLILPSAHAELQALVTVLDHAAHAGLSNVQIVRFGAPE